MTRLALPYSQAPEDEEPSKAFHSLKLTANMMKYATVKFGLDTESEYHQIWIAFRSQKLKIQIGKKNHQSPLAKNAGNLYFRRRAGSGLWQLVYQRKSWKSEMRQVAP